MAKVAWSSFILLLTQLASQLHTSHTACNSGCQKGFYCDGVGRCHSCSMCQLGTLDGSSSQLAPFKKCRDEVNCPNWCDVQSASRVENVTAVNEYCEANYPRLPTTTAPPIITSLREEETEEATSAGEKTLRGQLPPTPTPENKKNFVTTRPTGDTSSGGIQTDNTKLEVIVLGVLSGVLAVSLCGFLGWLFIRRQKRNLKSRTLDVEIQPLFEQDLALETPDFMHGTVTGLLSVWSHSTIGSIVIKKNSKKIAKVERSPDALDSVEVGEMRWDDVVLVRMIDQKSKKNVRVKELKMNCLRIAESNLMMTAATIECPPISDTFTWQLGERCGQKVKWISGQSGLVVDGRKELSELRPGITYCVQLSVEATRKGSSACWKQDFTTKSLTFQSITSRDQSATLKWMEALPDAVELYMGINDQGLERLTGDHRSFTGLIPGFQQWVTLKVKEGNSYRTLHQQPFNTSGHVKDGGDYKDCVTTEYESLTEPKATKKKSKHRERKLQDVKDGGDYKDCVTTEYESLTEPKATKKKSKHRERKLQDVKDGGDYKGCVTTEHESLTGPKATKKKPKHQRRKCDTSFLAALISIKQTPTDRRMYIHADQAIATVILERLQELFSIIHEAEAPSIPPPSSGLAEVEILLKQWNLQDETGIFDILRKFVGDDRVTTAKGLEFAVLLNKAHFNSTKCFLCGHVIFLLEKAVKGS